MGIALLFILVFRSDDSGCGLFQILWILHPRPLSFDAQYLTPDTHLRCSVSYTRYTSLSTPDSALPSQALMHPIVSEPSLQDVHPSSPVAIGLPAFGLCHLANTLTIQWESWRLSSQGEEADCVQPASQPHHQPWCSKVVNPTLQQVDDLQIG